MLHVVAERCCVQILVSLASILAVHCERPPHLGLRIVGGVETTIAEVPYLVNLRQQGQFSCGGALVTPKCVLTAAHCVSGVSPAALTIHAGASRLSEQGEVRTVVQYYVSPFYTPATLSMDVAIVKLTSALSGQNIATIPLCRNRPENDDLVKISGWGITHEQDPNPPDQVRTANVHIISKKECMLAYAGSAQLTSTMFCAAVPGEKDSCAGDSGGPLVYKGQVCGIVSWGIGCARTEYPGVYTNVASLRVNAFIKQTLMVNCL